MKASIFKPILIGILLGAFVFFTGPLLLIILILKFIFTPFGMWRMRYSRPFFFNTGMPFAFAEKVRAMSDEEFNSFKEKTQNRFNGMCTSQNY